MWPTHYIPNVPRVEGVPPPRYYLTTPPYPVEVVEEILSEASNPRAGFTPVATAEETMTTNGAVVSGVLQTLLLETSVLPDDIESNGAVISGVLVDRLILQSTGAVISGILRDPLVRYENWPLGFDSEDLQSAGMPVSGALT
jgi:hypothetical protein